MIDVKLNNRMHKEFLYYRSRIDHAIVLGLQYLRNIHVFSLLGGQDTFPSLSIHLASKSLVPVPSGITSVRLNLKRLKKKRNYFRNFE